MPNITPRARREPPGKAGKPPRPQPSDSPRGPLLGPPKRQPSGEAPGPRPQILGPPERQTDNRPRGPFLGPPGRQAGDGAPGPFPQLLGPPERQPTDIPGGDLMSLLRMFDQPMGRMIEGNQEFFGNRQPSFFQSNPGILAELLSRRGGFGPQFQFPGGGAAQLPWMQPSSNHQGYLRG